MAGGMLLPDICPLGVTNRIPPPLPRPPPPPKSPPPPPGGPPGPRPPPRPPPPPYILLLACCCCLLRGRKRSRRRSSVWVVCCVGVGREHEKDDDVGGCRAVAASPPLRWQQGQGYPGIAALAILKTTRASVCVQDPMHSFFSRPTQQHHRGCLWPSSSLTRSRPPSLVRGSRKPPLVGISTSPRVPVSILPRCQVTGQYNRYVLML